MAHKARNIYNLALYRILPTPALESCTANWVTLDTSHCLASQFLLWIVGIIMVFHSIGFLLGINGIILINLHIVDVQ